MAGVKDILAEKGSHFLSIGDQATVFDAALLMNEHKIGALPVLRNGKLKRMQIVGDTNPDRPTHWVKARSDRGAMRMIESRHEDNPVLFDDDAKLTDAGVDYMRRLDALTGVRHARLRKGLWVAAEGIIFEQWDPVVHVVDRFEIPDAWPRFWAVDFGYTNPFVAQWWAQDPDGRLIMYRELYHTGRLVEDHARQMLDLVTDDDGVWTEPKPRAVICDHDAEGRATLKKHLGLNTTAARKDVQLGLEATMARIRVAGDGRPRLAVMEDSVVERDPDLVDAMLPIGLVEEIPGYIWEPSADGKPAKETPLKKDDHSADTMRYMVAHVDLGNRPNIRILGG